MRIRKLISLIVLFCLVFTTAGPGYVFARKNTLQQNSLRVPASKDNIEIPGSEGNEGEINKNIRTTIGDVVNHYKDVVLPKLNYEKFYQLSQKVAETKRNNKKIIVMGEGRSGEVIAAFQKCLEEQGVNVVRLKESKTVPEIEEGDMIILISGSGRTYSIEETAGILEGIRSKKSKKKFTFVGLTATPDADTWKDTDILINIPGKTKLQEEGILTMGGEFEQASLWLLYRLSKMIFAKKNREDFISKFKEILAGEIENLKDLPNRLPEKEITDFVNLLEKAVKEHRTIFIAGKVGLDNHLAEIFAMRMQNLHKIKENFRALVYNVYDGLKPECKEGDILIILSDEGGIAKNKCIIKEAHKNDIVLITASGVNYGLSKRPTINIKLNSKLDNFGIETAVLLDSVFESLRMKLNVPKSALRLGHIQDTELLAAESAAGVKMIEKPKIEYTPVIENIEKMFSGFTGDINDLLKSWDKDEFKQTKKVIYEIYKNLRRFDKTSGKIFLFGEEKERLILDDFGKQLYAHPLGYLFAVPNKKRDYPATIKNRAEQEMKDLKILMSKLGIKEDEGEDKSHLKMLILEGIIEALLGSKGELTEKEVFNKIISYIQKISFQTSELEIDKNKFQAIVKMIIEAKLNDREVFIFGAGRSIDIVKLLGYDLIKLGISIPEPDRLPRIRPEDLVIVLSKSGETPELLTRLKSIKGQENKIVLITGDENSKLAKKVSGSPKGLVVKIDTGVEQVRRKGVVRSYKERGLRGLFPEQEKPSEMYFHILSAFYFRGLALAVKENLDDLNKEGKNKKDIRLEIGYGSEGGNLLELAREEPSRECWGIDISKENTFKLKEIIKKEKLNNIKPIEPDDDELKNLNYRELKRKLIDKLDKNFKPNSVNGIYINYPDIILENLIVDEEILKKLSDILATDGEIVIVSENDGYIGEIKSELSKIPGIANPGGFLEGFSHYFSYKGWEYKAVSTTSYMISYGVRFIKKSSSLESNFGMNLLGVFSATALQKALILAAPIVVALSEKMPGQAKYLPVVLWGATMFIALLNTLRNREQVHSPTVNIPAVEKLLNVVPAKIDQFNTSI